MDGASLINDHDLFECNLCSFKSGYGESVNENLIEHVNCPEAKETTNGPEETVKLRYQVF